MVVAPEQPLAYARGSYFAVTYAGVFFTSRDGDGADGRGTQTPLPYARASYFAVTYAGVFLRAATVTERMVVAPKHRFLTRAARHLSSRTHVYLTNPHRKVPRTRRIACPA